jgi:hypothetical protein
LRIVVVRSFGTAAADLACHVLDCHHDHVGGVHMRVRHGLEVLSSRASRKVARDKGIEYLPPVCLVRSHTTVEADGAPIIDALVERGPRIDEAVNQRHRYMAARAKLHSQN